MSPRRREAPVANPIVEREMQELHAILETMEAEKRRAPNVGDVNEVESEEVEVK
jgi:hypothetical protein